MNADLGLVEDDFATHYSDLYVVSLPGVHEWLNANHEFPKNIKPFISQKGSNWNGQGKLCFDIPFANAEYWEEKMKK